MNLSKEQIDHMVQTMSVSERKSWIQNEGYQAWTANHWRGTMEMATGTGKTRIGIRAIVEELQRNPDALIYVVGPTRTLLDDDWPRECIEAGHPGLMEKVRVVTWVSLGEEKPERDVDLVILDEVHHITNNSAMFFNGDWTVYKRMGLTATVPEDEWDDDKAKLFLIDSMCPPVFQITLDQGVALKIITDFEVFCLSFDLDSHDRYLETGPKNKRYKTTEEDLYKKLTKMMQRGVFMNNEGLKFMAIQKRTEFLYNLRTKTRLAQDVIKAVTKKNERTIMFCGSIEQSVELCGDYVYNSSTDTQYLDLFREEKIPYIGVVRAVDEGKNLPNVDQILIVQLTSKARQFIQRVGRAVRWRESHIPRIIVLVARKTADEKWFKSATKKIGQHRIKHHHVKPEIERA